jgi:hypothetical protein
MTENDPIKDYAADAAVAEAPAAAEPAPAAPEPVQAEVTSTGKKRGRPKAGTAAAETFKEPEPAEEVYMDARTRLEIEAGAAILRANQERLKQAE